MPISIGTSVDLHPEWVSIWVGIRIQKIIDSRTHPEQAYRSCLGILRLEKHYPKERLENACLRALKFSALSFKALRNILSAGLDRLEEKPQDSPAALPTHENVRGPHYYH